MCRSTMRVSNDTAMKTTAAIMAMTEATIKINIFTSPLSRRISAAFFLA
jgi:hypothetical protein